MMVRRNSSGAQQALHMDGVQASQAFTQKEAGLQDVERLNT